MGLNVVLFKNVTVTIYDIFHFYLCCSCFGLIMGKFKCSCVILLTLQARSHAWVFGRMYYCNSYGGIGLEFLRRGGGVRGSGD